jgi:hypothetical protein
MRISTKTHKVTVALEVIQSGICTIVDGWTLTNNTFYRATISNATFYCRSYGIIYEVHVLGSLVHVPISCFYDVELMLRKGISFSTAIEVWCL